MPALARLGPRSPGWARAARASQPDPGGLGGSAPGGAINSHKYGALENGGAVTALGTLKLVPYLPPQSRAVGRPGWQPRFRRPETEVAAGTDPAHRLRREPARRGSDRAGPAFTSDRAAAPRRPRPGLPHRLSAFSVPPDTSGQEPDGEGEWEVNRTLPVRGLQRPQVAHSGSSGRAAKARGPGAVPLVEGACPSACGGRCEGQGAVPPAKPRDADWLSAVEARGGGVPHVSPPGARVERRARARTWSSAPPSPFSGGKG